MRTAADYYPAAVSAARRRVTGHRPALRELAGEGQGGRRCGRAAEVETHWHAGQTRRQARGQGRVGRSGADARGCCVQCCTCGERDVAQHAAPNTAEFEEATVHLQLQL